MAILKHTYKVAITRTNIGYDIVINEFAKLFHSAR